MKLLGSLSNLCVLIGAYSLVNTSYDLYNGFYKYYQRPVQDLKKLYGDGYAIITGATDGLGKSLSNQLALLGHNLIIISRNKEKLLQRKEELEKFNIKVEICPFDLSTTEMQDYKTLADFLSNFEISLLVNNAAGFSEKNTSELSFKEIKDLIASNCLSSLLLTRTLWPQLKSKPKKSGIITIGSQYVQRRKADSSNVYFATKYFTNIFNKTFSSQILKPKINLSIIYPGLIRTEMFQRFLGRAETFQEGLLIEDPNYLAKQSLKCVGYEREIFGSERHAFMHYLMKYIGNRFSEM